MTPRAVTAVIPQCCHAGVTPRGESGVTTRIVTPIVTGPVTPPAAATQLVLSLFPGIDLLGMAFRAAGMRVVSGPDLITGGRIEDFHGIAGRFDGIIAGPPCQDFSCARRNVPPSGYGLHCLRELLRVIVECEPIWWLVENVPGVPDLAIDGYGVQRLDVTDAEFSGRQLRRRHIQFGHRAGWIIRPERRNSVTPAVSRPRPWPATAVAFRAPSPSTAGCRVSIDRSRCRAGAGRRGSPRWETAFHYRSAVPSLRRSSRPRPVIPPAEIVSAAAAVESRLRRSRPRPPAGSGWNGGEKAPAAWSHWMGFSP